MDWRRTAEAQDAVITRAQLRACGATDRVVDRMLTAGELCAVARGVFVVGGAPLTSRARLWVAVLATGGVLCRTTAGRLWDVSVEPRIGVDVLVSPRRRVIAPDGVRVYHGVSGRLAHLSGLPVTARHETVLDLLTVLPRAEADALADRALQRGWLTRDQLVRGAQQRRGSRGNAQLRRLVEQTSDGAAAVSERVLHTLLRRAGITGWVANHPVWHDGELVGTVDVAFPGLRIAIEIDGWAFHHARDRFQRDRTKQNGLIGLEWVVLRFTWADLTDRPGHVVAQIAAVLDRRKTSPPLAG